MLVKITGDPDVMGGIRTDGTHGNNWQLDNSRRIDAPRQLQRLAQILGVDSHGGGLPAGYRLFKSNGGTPTDELRTDKTPAAAGLKANDYVYVAYEEPSSPSSKGSIPDANTSYQGSVAPNVYSGTRKKRTSQVPNTTNQNSNELIKIIDDKQKQVEQLGQKLHESESHNQELRRQLLQVSEELRMRSNAIPGQYAQLPQTGPASRSPAHNQNISPSHMSDIRSHATGTSLGDEALEFLREENRSLRSKMNAMQNKLRETEIQLEVVKAKEDHHDCSVTQQLKPSNLRKQINDMNDTLRNVVKGREEARENLATRRRDLGDRFASQTASGKQFTGEASANIGPNGAQLMPSPYYMDPYSAPASVYQVAAGRTEGTVCKLKVQTLSGEGTVVRRVYSALTKNNQNVLMLASLDGVVTDEIVSSELQKAGVGHNRPDLLFLATARHRWVLSMEPDDRQRWMDWLVKTNPTLGGQ